MYTGDSNEIKSDIFLTNVFGADDRVTVKADDRVTVKAECTSS